MGLAQHSLNISFLAWICLYPFLLIIHRLNSYKQIIKYFFLWGVTYNLISLFWLATNIGTSIVIATLLMILTVLYLSINFILIGIIWFRLKSFFNNYSIIIFAIVWTCIEFIKSYGLLAFPWISIANTQTDYFYLIQIAEYVGIYGVTFWIVLVNGLLFLMIENKFSKHYILYYITIFISPFLLGCIIYNNLYEYEDDYQISIVQPNINLKDSRDYSKKFELLDNLLIPTKECIDNNSKLIIWPEASLPFGTIQNDLVLNYINKKLSANKDVYILTGDSSYDNDETYNTTVLFNNEGVKKVYKKQYLVPFAEQVPLTNVFPKLKEVNVGVASYSNGVDNVIFNIDNRRFSSLICYESTFPGINRQHVKLGVDFITFLVNDAWYITWPEPEQHAKQSIYRAIENRRTVLRSANTGISLVVDPSGYVREKTNLNENTVITTFLKKTNYTTFYTKFGNVFVYILLIILGTLFVLTFKKNEK